ncbi:MAG: biotin--[acetyl-CoA-carboxylase] ligase, partial [Odoribacter sp.]
MKSYEISGFEVMEYEEAVSTNTLAEGIPFKEWRDRTVVLTYRQTGGRGQASNRWESEAGKNISMTVVLKPAGLEAGKQFAVSMVVALGVLDFVRSRVGRGTVKWPNDVYVE